MCCQTTRSHFQADRGNLCGCNVPYADACQCGCDFQTVMSKKKKIQALKGMQSHIQDKLDDIKEYIKELEK